MRRDDPIGEIIIKDVDIHNHSCRFSIHLKNDAVKNRGYGTIAEKKLLQFAFTVLDMHTVYADALIKNRRSCRVLEKTGFIKISQDALFSYYKCSRNLNRERLGNIVA